MKVLNLHPWDVTEEEAIQIQKRLSFRLSLKNNFTKIEKVAGADVSYSENRSCSAAVVVDIHSKRVVERRVAFSDCRFPYVPGLLTFREGPGLCYVFESIKEEPDLIIFSGQGIAHPRRMGIAAHLGILLDKPTIGCAKSRLIGEFCPDIPKEKGSYRLLKDRGEVVGAVLRTRANINPLFVSPGHHIDIPQTIKVVLSLCKYRLPEPLRLAHTLSKQWMESC
jgi:deoxyribonuclease V